MAKRRKMGLMIRDGYLKAKFFRHSMVLRYEAIKRVKILNGGYKGTNKEYKDVVLSYWKKYGVKPKKYWFQMYCDGKDAFDPRYIPDSMWMEDIEPYFNNLIEGVFFHKGSYDVLFPHLRRPKTITKNIFGRFYGENQDLITEDEAVARAVAAERFIIKFTNSSQGRDVQVFERGEVTEEVVRALFKEYRFNFIIQELVAQHADLAEIHAGSLNTLRIMSFFFKGEVYILSAQLRMGSGDARIDNYSQGGYACNVNPDGRLSERAVSKAEGWAYVHPCGKKFSDIVVPNYDKVLDVIKEEHPKIPQLGIIGWDFAVADDGEPVFIEINYTPETNQKGSGPTFGDLTEAVLQDVFVDKTLKGAYD